MATKIAELRELARGATPGPWHSDGTARAEIDNDEARYADLVRVPTQDGRALAATWAWPVFDRREQAVANAAYIAAASPDVILGLLDRIAELERGTIDEPALAETLLLVDDLHPGLLCDVSIDDAAAKTAAHVIFAEYVEYRSSSKVETGVEK